ncbi:MAG TPA: hypothetical protein PK250_07565 [Syntrophobacter fumaroxidans]|nr:hypothetical protein [Syntrophobacter fumaroxidans]
MSGAELPDGFPDCFEKLKSLFPSNHFTKERLQRLDEIYRACESAWEFNLRERIGGKTVKYLLIAEAPPWSEMGENINYFYINCAGQWVQRIWKAFFPTEKMPHREEALERLANCGFLLIVSLFFAERYTSAKRNTQKYKELVKACSTTYFQEKINDGAIGWADEVKVALAFKLNGRAVIQSFPNGLLLPTGQRIVLTEEVICADPSGYTNSAQLRSAFGLHEHG